jgi:large subunit ribosomal protein L32
MGLPKKRISRTRGRKRRTHDTLKKTAYVTCTHCKEPVLPHCACKKCGYYKGQSRIVIAKTA